MGASGGFWRSQDRQIEELAYAYESVKTAQLVLWSHLQNKQRDAISLGQLDPRDEVVNAVAEYDEAKDVLAVTVYDVVPHKATERNRKLYHNLALFWAGGIGRAIARLRETTGFNRQFVPGFCRFVLWLPTAGESDVDNRAIKLVIDGLRGCGVLAGDSWEHMGYMVVGGVDKDNPRTVVYVSQPAQDLTELEVP